MLARGGEEELVLEIAVIANVCEIKKKLEIIILQDRTQTDMGRGGGGLVRPKCVD